MRDALGTPLLAPGGTLVNITAQRSAGCDSDIENTRKRPDWGRLSGRPKEVGWGLVVKG